MNNSKNNHKASTCNKQSNQKIDEEIFFNKILFVPQILDSPYSHQSIMRKFFSEKQIRSIRISGKLMYVDFNRKQRKSRKQHQNVNVSYNNEVVNQLNSQSNNSSVKYCQNEQIDKQTKRIKVQMAKAIPNLRNKISLLSDFKEDDRFIKFCKQHENQYFIAYNSPVTEDGPILKTLALSEKIITTLGYSPNELCLELSRYKQSALDFLSNELYQRLFFVYTQTLIEYANLTSDEFLEKQKQFIKYKPTTLQSSLVGKQKLKLIVNYQIYVPCHDMIYTGIKQIIKIEKPENYLPNLERLDFEIKAQGQLISSLNKIIKLPYNLRPEMAKRTCCYVNIDWGITKDSRVKKEESPSDYREEI